jgi:hypothetical protein
VRIIYYSYWGTYAAYTMAALHVGIYPEHGMPPEGWVASQFMLCRRYGEQTGNLIFVGLDDQLREVYSLGCRRHAGMVIRALQYISQIFHIEEPNQFIDARQWEGRLPGLLQRPGLQKWQTAEKLFAIWFRKKYSACLQEVQQVRQTLKDGINE